MQDTMSSTNGFKVTTLQPKFQDCQLTDKDSSSELYRWIETMDSIVSNLRESTGSGGHELVEFLDHYLKRAAPVTATRPSFLSDPALRYLSLIHI